MNTTIITSITKKGTSLSLDFYTNLPEGKEFGSLSSPRDPGKKFFLLWGKMEELAAKIFELGSIGSRVHLDQIKFDWTDEIKREGKALFNCHLDSQVAGSIKMVPKPVFIQEQQTTQTKEGKQVSALKIFSRAQINQLRDMIELAIEFIGEVHEPVQTEIPADENQQALPLERGPDPELVHGEKEPVQTDPKYMTFPDQCLFAARMITSVTAEITATKADVKKVLNVGQNKAQAVLGTLEESGILGPAKPKGPRDILFEPSDMNETPIEQMARMIGTALDKG